jgi:hypothetical protein
MDPSIRDMRDEAGCELCEAARMTEWFYEDEECWIAECEQCAVPMVVWRRHDPAPPDRVRSLLWQRLDTVVAVHYTFEHYVDDHMRSIPHHYHAHARPRGGFFGHGLRRRHDVPSTSTQHGLT